MFTGLIQSVGHIVRLNRQGQTIQLTCQSTAPFLADYKLGDSMAVNGVCLTAVAKEAQSFTVEMMPETFQRTNFSQLKPGAKVNLEKALAYNGRLEGHFVTGHVDATARLLKRQLQENALLLTFSLPAQLKKEIISKGSIALNGVSLTVISTKSNSFTVGMIPHSQTHTNLADLAVGEFVNVESDILGKYLVRSGLVVNKS